MISDRFLEPLRELAEARPALRIGASIKVAGQREQFAEAEVLDLASVGKILLLVETARQLEIGAVNPLEPLDRRSVQWVADSGLWQHLATDSLPLIDAVRLVAAVSDNLATNLLLGRVGIAAVDDCRAALGLEQTRLLDRIRDRRGPEDPVTFARGTAAELVDVVERLATGTAVSPAVSRMVLDWMAINTDQAMVGGGFDLDPLAHASGLDGFQLYNKTGSDVTVRADVGGAIGPTGRVAYAVIVNLPSADAAPVTDVLAAMRSVGARLREALAGTLTAR